MRRNDDGRSTRVGCGWLLALVLVFAGCAGERPKPAAPAPGGAATQAGREEARAKLEEEKAGEGALGEGVRMLSLPPVYFDFDSAVVRPDQRRKVEQAAEFLQRYPAVRVRLEGHADERGPADYNMVLGKRRADAVKRLLVALGVDAGRIEVVSYGEEFPADPGHDEAAWAKNRRVEFVFRVAEGAAKGS